MNWPRASTFACLPSQAQPNPLKRREFDVEDLAADDDPEHPDDWNIGRFSLLADELGYDQLWLMAVDVGDGLTAADAYAVRRFRENGGGVLTARDHQDLGCCLSRLGSLGVVNEFHDGNVDPATMCDDQDTPTISWPNYHSGANGDYQPVLIEGPVHELLRTNRTASGRIEWFPAHPHEGLVSAKGSFASAIAQGRSTATGRHFNLAVVLDGEQSPDGRPMGRAVAESTFHHFADYNWDLDRGAPSFVTEPPGTQIKADPSRLAIFKDYVRNIATWLDATKTPDADTVIDAKHTNLIELTT